MITQQDKHRRALAILQMIEELDVRMYGNQKVAEQLENAKLKAEWQRKRILIDSEIQEYLTKKYNDNYKL